MLSCTAETSPTCRPGDCDLLQVFWCPFDAHGPTGHGMLLDLRWRRSWEVAEVMTAPPQPQVVGSEGYVPEPCLLHPEQVATYPLAGLLPEDLCARIDTWEEALEEEAEQWPDTFQRHQLPVQRPCDPLVGTPGPVARG